jgi:sugar/nucleoside kinase (ribokinase family)
MMRKGIAVAGNMVVDRIITVDSYPQPQHLAPIRQIDLSLGGAVNNVVIDLALIDPGIPLTAIGHVGTDPEGQLVLGILRQHQSIDVSMVSQAGITAFTDVMYDLQTLQRTFFTYSGADTLLGRAHFNFGRIQARILHIAYVLLLPGMDAADETYGTVMARTLHDAQSAGLKTSTDVVSEEGNRYAELVPHALRYTDYCIINEHEAAKTVGIPVRDTAGVLLEENIPAILISLKRMGVSTWACIHCPEAGFGLDEQDQFYHVPSLKLPRCFIKGTVGAGDAFCAGVLYGAHEGWALDRSLQFGAGSAAASLSQPGSTAGMRSAAGIWQLIEQLS